MPKSTFGTDRGHVISESRTPNCPFPQTVMWRLFLILYLCGTVHGKGPVMPPNSVTGLKDPSITSFLAFPPSERGTIDYVIISVLWREDKPLWAQIEAREILEERPKLSSWELLYNNTVQWYNRQNDMGWLVSRGKRTTLRLRVSPGPSERGASGWSKPVTFDCCRCFFFGL